MKQSFKLFKFQGSQISISIWVLLLFVFLPLWIVISLLISVLIHELAHAWMSNRKGYKVYGINIDIISGSTSIDPNTHDVDLIPISAAGPISTLILCGISYIINTIMPNVFTENMFKVNLVLFLFNILPIYPMDGGQIVRSFLTLKSKNRHRGRVISNKISLFFSIGIIFYFIINFNLFLILIGAYFAYIALKDLSFLKN